MTSIVRTKDGCHQRIRELAAGGMEMTSVVRTKDGCHKRIRGLAEEFILNAPTVRHLEAVIDMMEAIRAFGFECYCRGVDETEKESDE